MFEYPTHDKLGFLKSKYKFTMSSVFKSLKLNIRNTRKRTDFFKFYKQTPPK